MEYFSFNGASSPLEFEKLIKKASLTFYRFLNTKPNSTEVLRFLSNLEEFEDSFESHMSYGGDSQSVKYNLGRSALVRYIDNRSAEENPKLPDQSYRSKVESVGHNLIFGYDPSLFLKIQLDCIKQLSMTIEAAIAQRKIDSSIQKNQLWFKIDKAAYQTLNKMTYNDLLTELHHRWRDYFQDLSKSQCKSIFEGRGPIDGKKANWKESTGSFKAFLDEMPEIISGKEQFGNKNEIASRCFLLKGKERTNVQIGALKPKAHREEMRKIWSFLV